MSKTLSPLKPVTGATQTFQGLNLATGEALEGSLPKPVRTRSNRPVPLPPPLSIPIMPRVSNSARFLETIAQQILDIGDALVERAMAETGLPHGRIEGERGRTVGRLRLFASVVRDGGWLNARIDPAQPNRTPLPRSDLRQRAIGLGPVAVFGVSNFPLAFSVAGATRPPPWPPAVPSSARPTPPIPAPLISSARRCRRLSRLAGGRLLAAFRARL